MILFLMLAAVLVIYSRSIRGEFLFDDHAITDMDFKRWRTDFSGGQAVPGLPPSFKRALNTLFIEDRALTHMGYLWTYEAAGFSPIVWHAVNIVFHLANTVLVFLLALSIRPAFAGPAAFLFAVHPHQVSAVSYVSGRASLQSAFFALAAVYLTITGYFVAPVLCTIFAMRSKEDGLLWIILLWFGFKALSAWPG